MRRMRIRSGDGHAFSRRRAYTLVELLVVVAIIILLTSMTVAAVNFSANADRVRASARQIQSLISGARDRAIYAKDVRGIRLIRDPNDNHTVNAFQYVGAPGKVSMIGALNIPMDLNNPTFTVPTFGDTINDGTCILATGTNNLFMTLKNQGLIRVGSRIQIPYGTGRWYTIAGVSRTPLAGASDQIVLAQPYSDYVIPAFTGGVFSNPGAAKNISGLTYQLELQPQPLPDSPPVQLPRGAVIDLDGSNLPASWYPPPAATAAVMFAEAYSNQMDILFSAKGVPVGDVTTFGLSRVHLHIADAGDVARWKNVVGRSSASYSPPVIPSDNMVEPNSPTNAPIVKGDHILVSLATRTGNVAVYPVNTTATTTVGTNILLSDPYFYAETGVVAGK